MKSNKLFIILIIITCIFTSYLLYDTFLKKEVYDSILIDKDDDINTGEVIILDNSYQDDNISITITEYYEYDTSIYVADIILSDIKYLKTAFANNTYGKNITATTSSIASSNSAILAINGDYYGVQENGYVLRNGVIYRSSVKSNQQDLVIYDDGTFDLFYESEWSLSSLTNAYQVLSFGPGLINDYNIIVNEDSEVARSKSSNPRTAIGIIDTNHIIFLVSDGRTSNSAGLTLYELAEFMESLGVGLAYNLDGGGSSTMYFNGNIINNPTSSGRVIKEREVSDIVYIGY